MKSLLVTGGAGFIGSNFVHYWLERYPEDRIVIVDALTYAGNRDNLTGVSVDANLRFEHADINDTCLLYTSPSPRDATLSRMPSSA